MVRFLINAALWGATLIGWGHLLEGSAYSDLSEKECGIYKMKCDTCIFCRLTL